VHTLKRIFSAPNTAILLLLLHPVLFYRRVLITVATHVPYDIENYHFPTLALIARSIRQHQWPFWDPYTYAGMPLHADMQAQLFYPPAWLAIAAGNVSQGRHLFYWVEWLNPLHMMLGGVFTWVLLRRMNLRSPAALTGATVYQLGGYFASQACHLGAICAGAWLPLAILAVHELRERFRPRWFAALAVAIALTILAGFAAATLVVCGAVILFAAALLFRRETSWRRFAVLGGSLAGSFVLAALISAVELIPLMRLTGQSIASTRSEWLTAWGIPPEALMSLIRPDYYGIFDLSRYQLHFNFTLMYVYHGMAPLGLLAIAAFQRRARTLLTLTVLCACWMLGEHTPLYGLIFGHLPGLIRGASYAWYAMMAFGLFAGMTAAVALDGMSRRIPESAMWAVALVTSADLLLVGSDRPMNSAPGGYALSSSEYQFGAKPEDLARLRALTDISVPPLRIDYADIWSPGILQAGMLRLPTSDGNIPFMSARMYRLRQLYCATEPNARDLAAAGAESPIFRRDLPVVRFDSPLIRMTNTGYVASL